MGIIDKLASVGAAPIADPASVALSAHTRDDAHPFQIRRRSIVQGKARPLVSCLMVTRGDRWTIKYALECYRRQTYENRELIIVVNKENYTAVSALVIANAIDGASVFGVDPDAPLGDCRNMSLARARGDILMQWDDDDLYDPLRIAVSVSALIERPAAAALLSRWTVWWPSRELAAISGRRMWEGSIAVWREHARAYPNRARGEDTYVTECLANSSDLIMIDAPLLYIYVVSAQNAFSPPHYENIIRRADCTVRGEAYDDLIKIMSERVPMLEYAADARNLANA